MLKSGRALSSPILLAMVTKSADPFIDGAGEDSVRAEFVHKQALMKEIGLLLSETL